MDHVADHLRKYFLIKMIAVISLVPLSAPVVANPVDSMNIWFPVINALSDNEDKAVVKPGMSDVTGYSDDGIEVEKDTGRPDVKQNSHDQELFKRTSISVHVGQTRMQNLDQSLDMVVGTECALWIFGCVYDRDIIEPLPITFKTTPSLAWSIALERHTEGLWSYGLEYYRSIHEYTAASLIPTDGELEMSRSYFTLKKYFEVSKAFQPYIGVSGGLFDARMSGAITSSSDTLGYGWTGEIGAIYKFEHINLRASYRHSNSHFNIQAHTNDGLRRKVHGDISTQSEGYFLGMAVRF
jgi:hypothetical protein